eukprot:365845-Chlamydomonas_euryale.AAC.9
MSCANYQNGLYTTYQAVAESDADLVVFLGDYIYEGAAYGANSQDMVMRAMASTHGTHVGGDATAAPVPASSSCRLSWRSPSALDSPHAAGVHIDACAILGEEPNPASLKPRPKQGASLLLVF